MRRHRIAVLVGLLALATSSRASDERTQSVVPFEDVRGKLVILSANNAAASGFIAEIEGHKYVITCEHVLRAGPPIIAKLIDGRQLHFSEFSLSESSDLVRLSVVETNLPAFSVAPSPPALGTAVSVFGNSDGAGAVTVTSGTVLGVGPNVVEVDVPFVRGNSGSPIVDRSSRVIAVATYATKPAEVADWVRRGTRFAEARRFGVTLGSGEWKTVSFEQYYACANLLADLEMFCSDLYDLSFTDKYTVDRITSRGRIKETTYTGNEYVARCRQYRELPKAVLDLATAMNEVARTQVERDYWQDQLGNFLVGPRGWAFSNAKQRAFHAERALQRSEQSIVAAKQRAYTLPKTLVSQNRWATTRLAEEATFWLDAVKAMTASEQKRH